MATPPPQADGPPPAQREGAGEVEDRGRATGDQEEQVAPHGWLTEFAVFAPALPGRGDTPFGVARSASWVPTEEEAAFELMLFPPGFPQKRKQRSN